jgi:hypothetical protein
MHSRTVPPIFTTSATSLSLPFVKDEPVHLADDLMAAMQRTMR